MSKGFTLLELLVVIGVIGLLAAFSLPNFMAARERARDTQKKNDLVQIQKALELYKQDQVLPSYPNTLPTPNVCWSSGAGCTGNIYMNRFPGSVAAPYYYSYVAATLSYTLAACLENGADPSGVVCPGGYTCTSAKCYIVTQP